jgi:PIN domain nuclease of toxin-antitoxin system
MVLDASALLALLNAENGAEVVQDLLPEAAISTVNLAEVVTRLAAAGMPEDEIRGALSLLGLETLAFDEELAFLAGFLVLQTQPLGLSLGDQACLALAKATQASAVTADRAWAGLDIGVEIRLIR